jgi:L-alanine-DL-glutamate epimerase-like enolase superfamily enzyme
MVHTTGGEPLLENGYANVPDSPGLGIELNMEHILNELHPDDKTVFASTSKWDNP